MRSSLAVTRLPFPAENQAAMSIIAPAFMPASLHDDLIFSTDETRRERWRGACASKRQVASGGNGNDE